jgi:hypothetical protein
MARTESFFGWTMPSRDAVQRATRALDSDEQSVRDEVGFLIIHDAYANRFFPGTSVQQTRLRYVLFVPWIYKRLFERGIKSNVELELAKEESNLVWRLMEIEKRGVIGATIYPRPAKQPPSVIYWSALNTWGLLRPDENGTQSRGIVHRMLERVSSIKRRHSSEIELEEGYDPFWTLPKPPKEWSNENTKLSFKLTASERNFLREKLQCLYKPQGTELSLLSRLVESKVAPSSLYSRETSNYADPEDREALKRARRAAALGAIGRGIYAALLEQICESEDARPDIGTLHRHHLFESLLPEFGALALQTRMADLIRDVPRMPANLVTVLEETLSWLNSADANLYDLRSSYSASESFRKQYRARLLTTGLARDRRNEWQPSFTKIARPLHYRWSHAQQFLRDLL